MAMAFDEKQLTEALLAFGEDVGASRVALPALSDPAMRWRLSVRLECGETSTAIFHQWVEEPCEAKP